MEALKTHDQITSSAETTQQSFGSLVGTLATHVADLQQLCALRGAVAGKHDSVRK